MVCFNLTFEKKGASEWSVGKMLAIIMTVLIIVLVIYGVSSGALNPLIERISGIADGIQTYFEDGDFVKDDGRFKIEGVGEGKLYISKEKCVAVFDNDAGLGNYTFDWDKKTFYKSDDVYEVNGEDRIYYLTFNEFVLAWEFHYIQSNPGGFQTSYQVSGFALDDKYINTKIGEKNYFMQLTNFEQGLKILNEAGAKKSEEFKEFVFDNSLYEIFNKDNLERRNIYLKLKEEFNLNNKDLNNENVYFLWEENGIKLSQVYGIRLGNIYGGILYHRKDINKEWVAYEPWDPKNFAIYASQEDFDNSMKKLNDAEKIKTFLARECA